MSNSFVSQLSMRNYEGFVLGNIYKEVCVECGDPRITKYAPTIILNVNGLNEVVGKEEIEDGYGKNIDEINNYFEGSYTMVIGEVR